jgi:hypothetical protein
MRQVADQASSDFGEGGTKTLLRLLRRVVNNLDPSGET